MGGYLKGRNPEPQLYVVYKSLTSNIIFHVVQRDEKDIVRLTLSKGHQSSEINFRNSGGQSKGIIRDKEKNNIMVEQLISKKK